MKYFLKHKRVSVYVAVISYNQWTYGSMNEAEIFDSLSDINRFINFHLLDPKNFVAMEIRTKKVKIE